MLSAMNSVRLMPERSSGRHAKITWGVLCGEGADRLTIYSNDATESCMDVRGLSLEQINIWFSSIKEPHIGIMDQSSLYSA